MFKAFLAKDGVCFLRNNDPSLDVIDFMGPSPSQGSLAQQKEVVKKLILRSSFQRHVLHVSIHQGFFLGILELQSRFTAL